MNEAQAKRILGITGNDTARTAKIKFRRLIGKYHPDAVGEDSVHYQEQAQQINAAYTFLKNKNFFGEKENLFDDEEAIRWNAPINEKAFADRNIYSPYHMEIDTDGMYQTITRGKYQWDPDEEEFLLFLRSILHTCKELLDGADIRCGMNGGTDHLRASFQKRLFHSLAMQYVDPLYCLEKIAEPEIIDPDGQKIYRFRAYIGKTQDKETTNRILSLQKGDLVYPASFHNWKLMVKDSQGYQLGYLSFAGDELYYCLFPLMQARLIQLRMSVVQVRRKKERFLFSAEAEIEFRARIRKEAVHYQNPDGNEEIYRILEEYQSKIAGFCR
ncbi:MAG: DnaJ domain-containing protein [Clostridiales bacterium]|nr:DnaJ domain-containing protein [Clostridiales bacterium]